jgi:hypothetical protein
LQQIFATPADETSETRVEIKENIGTFSGEFVQKIFVFVQNLIFFCTKSISNFPTNPRTFAEVLKPIKVQANEKIDLEKTS